MKASTKKLIVTFVFGFFALLVIGGGIYLFNVSQKSISNDSDSDEYEIYTSDQPSDSEREVLMARDVRVRIKDMYFKEGQYFLEAERLVWAESYTDGEVRERIGRGECPSGCGNKSEDWEPASFVFSKDAKVKVLSFQYGAEVDMEDRHLNINDFFKIINGEYPNDEWQNVTNYRNYVLDSRQQLNFYITLQDGLITNIEEVYRS